MQTVKSSFVKNQTLCPYVVKYNILIGHVDRIRQNGRLILEHLKGKCIWALTGFI